MEENIMNIQPGRALGFMTLGSSLHEVLTTIKGDINNFPRILFTHDDAHPIVSPTHVVLPDNGLRLQFDGPDQRLRLIEVLDFRKLKLVYKDVEVFKPAEIYNSLSAGASGPKFKHIYDKLLGPTYPGEYIPPKAKKGSEATGTYNLSYPGIAFNFPVQHSAYSPKKDFISLLSSSATGPATSMAIFSGDSWQKARGTLFTATPPYPRTPSVMAKGREGCADEIELARIHGEGRIELVRRSSPSFWLVLSETTPQDLIMELGPPDSIYRKSDRRLSIHKKDRRASDISDDSGAALSADDPILSEHGSVAGDDDGDDGWEDVDDGAEEEAREREVAAAEHFYNYYHHGFDILISQPTHPSPPLPGREGEFDGEGALAAQARNHLTATKIILHGNIPGSYQFNRHRRSRWVIELPQDPLTSELPYGEISSRLKREFKPSYDNEEEEQLQQRGMALNRGWGDSPSSSIELLGGWEDGAGKKGKSARSGLAASDGEVEVGKATLFGFPGLIFEVLHNGAVCALTVY
jgi:hypothetical protein